MDNSEIIEKIKIFCIENKELSQRVSIASDSMTAWAEAMVYERVFKYIKDLENGVDH